MRTWDVVVVGGGPAGAAFAARTAAAGHQVLVLDRAEFPRRKPCGECVNPAGVEALRLLGALERVEAGAARLDGWRIGRAGEDGFVGRFAAGRYGLAIGRAELDAALLALAAERGAAVRTGAHVADLLRDGGRISGVAVSTADGGREEVRARLVVGADGLRSVVVRRLGLLRRGPRLRKLALTAHLWGVEVEEGVGALRVDGDGCVGVAGLADGTANVSVVVTGPGMREAAGDAEGFFDTALRRYGVGGERVDDVLATGPFDWPVRAATAPGALLVGDAAGYYDPFTGQGIFRALRGAELAAGVADAALRAGDLSARGLAPYEAARRAAFGPGERLQRAIETVVSRPAALGWVSRRLARSPDAADALVAVAGDLSPVRSLLSRRVLRALAG